MASSLDFKSMQEKIQSALVTTTRTSNQIAAEDLRFQRTNNPAVGDQLDETSARLLALSTSLLKSAIKGTNIKPPNLEDTDDVDNHWTSVVDVLDTLLEKADTCLDEYTGLVKRKSAPTDELGTEPKKAKTFGALEPSMRRANILKPQNAFEAKPDNLDTSPWKPLLTRKPHAILPLDQSLGTLNNEGGSLQYKHPYETEILQLQYPQSVYEIREPIKYQPLETTVPTFVDTFEGVLDMLAELKQAKEIAIDLEHHDFRTYNGLLSLMQISTREQDWIVDTLQPWRHKLEILNEVFTDPSIVKVFHGAFMDILWLQRDVGLYIVGLFDTFHAADSLGYPGRSLAYLLKRFVDFDADKKYQLADWRIRPLPEEMMYYARSDTHFLLYIYDQIRNELVERSGDRSNAEQDYIGYVLDNSKETSLRRYEKVVYDAVGGQGAFGWFNMLVKQSAGSLTREQFSVFRAVHEWRDETARREDESPVYILTNGALFDIARRLPPDSKALHSLLGHNSSSRARRNVDELMKIVRQARKDGENGPSLVEFIRSSNANTDAAAQKVFPQLQAENTEGVLETKELVSSSSRFWGKVPVSSRWDEASTIKGPANRLQFALPWASFIENTSASETASAAEQQPAQPQAPREPEESVEVHDEEFTLRAGLRWKAPEPESESDEESEGGGEGESDGDGAGQTAAGTKSEPEEEISFLSSSDERRARKKARKAELKGLTKGEQKALKKAENKAEKRAVREAKAAARKARKAAKKAEKAQAKTTSDEDEDDEERFDYSKAQSVLNAQRSGANGERSFKGAFNPYSSSLMADGPKPARKMHGEKAGKSATFKKM